MAEHDEHDEHEHSRDEHVGHHEILFLNHKLTFDAALQNMNTAAVRSQEHHDELHQQMMRHNEELHTIAMQNLTAANSTQDMLAKQALRDRSLSTDRMWNGPDAVAEGSISASIARHTADQHHG